MRDLEIRGAGNLLGPEQSGHITAVGFELYCQLLKQSVSALKGERVQPRVSVEVRLDFLALNPGEVDPAPASELEDRRPRALDPADPGPTPPERGGAVGPWAAARPRIARAPAYVPLRYVSDARQRIELYRKLAQATDRAGLDRLEREIRKGSR